MSHTLPLDIHPVAGRIGAEVRSLALFPICPTAPWPR
jgi:hypothetical protein